MADYPNPNSSDDFRDRDLDRQRELEQERALGLERERLLLAQKRTLLAQKSAIALKFEQGIYYLVGALELLLALRFILRLMGANPENTFARVIYNLSNPFVAPVSTLFISPAQNNGANIFDLNLLIAMVAYLLLMGLVIGLVRILSSRA